MFNASDLIKHKDKLDYFYRSIDIKNKFCKNCMSLGGNKIY